MKDLFIDLEDNSVSVELLNIIGQVLDNVRIIVINDAERSMMGGGCHLSKCKHRIVLEKNYCSFIVLSVSEEDKYYLDTCLHHGVYRYKSYIFCKIAFCMLGIAATIMLYLQILWWQNPSR